MFRLAWRRRVGAESSQRPAWAERTIGRSRVWGTGPHNDLVEAGLLEESQQQAPNLCDQATGDPPESNQDWKLQGQPQGQTPQTETRTRRSSVGAEKESMRSGV